MERTPPKSNLTIHIKNAKKCIAKRNESVKAPFSCSFCSKTFTSNQNMIHHYDICKSKLITEFD